jgi:DNA-binding GntR family transcriptional regulator
MLVQPKTSATVAKKTGRSADSVEKVYEAVKKLAVDYHFRPGERINEVELAARLGVSRTPVREALNRLAQDGFMSWVPNRGFYSREITPQGVHSLYEMRAVIEQATFRFACERGSDQEIGETIAIWESHKDLVLDGNSVSNWLEVAEADEAFHLAIARMSRNDLLYANLESLNSLIRFFRRIDLETPSRRNDAYNEHVEIIDALRHRDAARGMQLIEKHVTLSSDHAVEVTKEGLARIFFANKS